MAEYVAMSRGRMNYAMNRKKKKKGSPSASKRKDYSCKRKSC